MSWNQPGPSGPGWNAPYGYGHPGGFGGWGRPPGPPGFGGPQRPPYWGPYGGGPVSLDFALFYFSESSTETINVLAYLK